MATFDPGQTALLDKLLRRSSAAAPVPIGKQKYALQPDLQAVIQTPKLGARIMRYELTDGGGLRLSRCCRTSRAAYRG
jgi:hypothetical protein